MWVKIVLKDGQELFFKFHVGEPKTTQEKLAIHEELYSKAFKKLQLLTKSIHPDYQTMKVL